MTRHPLGIGVGLALAMGALLLAGIALTPTTCGCGMAPAPLLEGRAEGPLLLVETSERLRLGDMLVVRDGNAVPFEARRDGAPIDGGEALRAHDVVALREGNWRGAQVLDLATNAYVAASIRFREG